MSLKKLGRYDLIRVVGKGAMGVVYEARDPNLDRRVAIKTIAVDAMSEQEAIEYEARFRTEARSAARLQHPHIVSVYDSDRDLDIAYLVMEFVEGHDLKHHLDSGVRHTLEQTVAIMGDLLSALDYAHRQNVVHRDIKPANLLIEASGRVKLTDFGVARIQDAADATRTRGTMVGTLKYMSPEQVRGLPVDARSDLFSAGIVLYQLLTSARPFEGVNDFDITQQIVSQDVKPPSDFNPSLPREIDLVVARALEKNRDRRFSSAAEFNTALQAAARSATDPTMVPPAAKRGPADSATWTSTLAKGASLLATGSGSTPGVPSSTVTQEVELVYWKEIKDSEEAQAFQGFLLRFPEGIYADLARRRLQRLQDGEQGSRSHAEAGPAPATTPGTASHYEPTQTLATASAGAPARNTGQPGARRWGPLLALLAATVVGGIAIGLTIGNERQSHDADDEPPVARPAVPYTPTSTPAAPPVTTAAPAPSAARPVADAPPKPTARAPAKAATPAAASNPGWAPATQDTPPAPVLAAPPKPAEIPDPRRECDGRILLGFETCMRDQCDKPKFAPHPVCVERRGLEERNTSGGG
ncbi:MAG: serine/threonine-protein kinase [Hylemonella sp.]|nr:serine/threonine-protein kinase [Hylemonella sp.]